MKRQNGRVALCVSLGCMGTLLASSCEDFDEYRHAAAAPSPRDDASETGAKADAASDSSSSSDADASTQDAPNDVSADARSIAHEKYLWNDGRPGHGARIPVCFTIRPHIEHDGRDVCGLQSDRISACNGEPFATYGTTMEALRTRVLEILENSWLKYTGIELVGLSDCPLNSNQTASATPGGVVQVTFVSSCPESERGNGGCQTAGYDPPPWDETRGRLGPSAKPTDVHIDWKALKDGKNDRAVVHQFGHALGFRHPEPSATADADAADAAASTCATPYERDPDPTSGISLFEHFYAFGNYPSIMDACPAEAGPALSPADVLGLQSWYGRPADGSLVGFGGHCLDMGGGRTATLDALAVTFACRGTANNTWLRDARSATEHLTTSIDGAPRCLRVRGDLASAGPTPVIASTCEPLASEAFATTGVEWRAVGGLCVRPDPAFTAQLVTARCSESVARWDFFHASDDLNFDQIRLSGSTKCVSAQTEAGGHQQLVQLAECSKTDRKQQFSSEGHGVIEYQRTGLRLTVLGSLPLPGAKIALIGGGSEPLFASYDAEFYLSGSIRALGQCMTTVPFQGSFGQVFVQPCAAAEAAYQTWDYYFGLKR